MTRYVAIRLFQALLVLLVMSVVIYGLIGLMPGDPIDLMLSADPKLTPADVAHLKSLYGLDLPLYERYLNWLGAALSGDLGYSRAFAKPVLDVLLPRLGNSAWLLGSSFLLSLALALPVGVGAAARPQGRLDAAVNLFCFAGISVPPFWLALLLIGLFSVELGWFPAGGMETVGDGSLGDRVLHLVLPVLALTLLSVAGFTRYLRAEMLEVLSQDYVRTARAKGVSERNVLLKHALRNALIPVVTVIGLDFGALFSGALITETMFAYPGMGKLIYDSIMGNDFNLAMVALLFATFMTLAANLLADLAVGWLDPRISLA
ncbi:MAG TPA: ABC transporter permease [Alphaproteobacteria bacterium]|nr:ABC transporter permease [Alphaproteobacteria bacterium]